MKDWTQVLEFLATTFGLNPESLGRKNLERLLEIESTQAGCSDPVDFLGHLLVSSDAREALFKVSSVTETWFFRGPEALAQLPDLVHKTGTSLPRGTPVRILSAPCSTGEEVYSIAMSLLEAGIPAERFSVLGVDLDRTSLEQARRGVYRKGAFRHDRPDLRDRFFPDHDDEYKVPEKIRDSVEFRAGNLIDPTFLQDCRPFQIIFCRNVLIYLNDEARGKLLRNILRLLEPEGTLFTGSVELSYFLANGFAATATARTFSCRLTVHKTAAVPVRADPKPEKSVLPPPAESGREAASPLSKPALSPTPFRAPETLSFDKPASPPPLPLAKARQLADQGNMLEAAGLCQEIILQDPTSAEAHFLLGLIRQAGNSLQAAEESFQRAVYLDPDHEEALVHLGLLYQTLGQQTKASIFLRRAQKLVPAAEYGTGRLS